ncbi:MAG: rod shape-determining protein MreC [Flavobacteriaceae bacterium]|tara:strand:- start:3224 stop:4018 length:795 start_codon:yes stop_codon:yes gene_type:complete
MQWLLGFILGYKNLFLYLFFVGCVLSFSVFQSEYHKSKLFKASIFITGKISEPLKKLTSYFRLKKINTQLIEENLYLKSLVIDKNYISDFEDEIIDSPYTLISGSVIKNDISSSRNVIIINKGLSDMVENEMGVIGSKGIVGIVNQTTEKFSSVLSILHKDIKINAKHKKSNAFGSLFWEGNAPDKVKLSDISIINKINVGDTIVTGGMSAYFPEGIPIGNVIEIENDGKYYSLKLKLINNMTNLDNVYILKNKNKSEIKSLYK